jgi:hypothetical protein
VTKRPARKLVIAAAVVALVAVVSVETASARKNRVIGTVNGKGYRWKGRFVVAGYSGAGTIIVATKPARPGTVLRTIGFGCAIYPPNETFPLTPRAEICNANYTETKVGRNVSIKGWLAVQGVQVTYQTFDGTRLTGTFEGVLDPVTGNGSPPVTIRGTFDTSVTPDS